MFFFLILTNTKGEADKCCCFYFLLFVSPPFGLRNQIKTRANRDWIQIMAQGKALFVYKTSAENFQGLLRLLQRNDASRHRLPALVGEKTKLFLARCSKKTSVYQDRWDTMKGKGKTPLS